MRYLLSLLIPVRFHAFCVAHISEREIVEGGHGNHQHGGPHADAEHVTWWQWRGHIMRYRTLRICAL
jgi:hypothetical protein